MAETAFDRLHRHFFDIIDLNGVGYLLKWDQATYMPFGGAVARGRQLGLVKTLAHEKLSSAETGKLLSAAEKESTDVPPDSFKASYLRIARRDFERATKLPSNFARRFSEHTAASYQAWTQARAADDFKSVEGILETTLELSRKRAALQGPTEHLADPLIAEHDYGMTVAQLRPLFGELREALVPLLHNLSKQERPDDSFLRRHYPLQAQFAFASERVAEFGYDFSRGRVDPTHHPFAIEFSLDDVRITTRGQEGYLPEALFCTFHESGHGMYHQGLEARLEGTPLADGSSAGVHESQSRLWENIVGRSQGFWHYALPKLKQVFPEQLSGIDLETFYRAINIVAPSAIRTQADEVSYNLHVIIRFELELELLEGTLEVAQLPTAWNAKYSELLGVEVIGDKDGVLQDVHWFSGPIGGAFQGYTLGNILSAQLYETACHALPEIPEQLSAGEFGTLYTWTRENIHRHGRRYDPVQLIERVCGQKLETAPYLRYLERKYSDLYGI